jgi:UV DNA damage endonuclease
VVNEFKQRLGFSVRVFGLPGVPSHDVRRPLGGAHLSVSLVYLRDILQHLRDHHIHMYRMHAELATPHASAELADVQTQLDECVRELAALGAFAQTYDVRLSFHPYSAVVLNTPNEDQLARSLACLQMQAALLDAMHLGPEAVMVLHVGGVYDDLLTSRERWVRRYETLPGAVRRRLVLENDDHRFSYADIRAIHDACGVPLVLDSLHHLVHNPQGVPMREALQGALATWPAQVTPKIHLSTPRTEMGASENPARIKAPSWTEHSDFVNPFEFIAFMRLAEGLRPFDVMLEAKARDLALIKLREDLCRFAPDLARIVG